MNTVTSRDGTRIAFERAGEGPALVLVDGAMCYRGAGPCSALAAELAGDFTVYTYDRRGRGESGDSDTFAVEREYEDLAALVEHAGGGASVFGHSSGAVLALEASLHGVDIARLALFEPPPAGEDAALAERLGELVRAGRRGEAVEEFQLAVGLPPEMVSGMRGSPFRAALEAIAPTLVYDTTITGSARLDRYAAIAVPTLLVDSENSPEMLRASTEEVARAVPGARRRSLPGGFHDVEPGTLAPVLAGFLL
ncbi:alpha/beta fold hydrolase [Nonomuraea phyllanthi]|uniref:Alpha/beta fold hydrolase n=1 Tax=Nonomuraea phyllanthi TaxID=2219224 RepID=A0A5C4WPQ2_9ACTN|nr:alpha/beta fold hydrolase [Nonomuraea phyllanthi]KAB8195366.1 alpha/beta fold hydrolase [Nonomuraea phyllanthi]